MVLTGYWGTGYRQLRAALSKFFKKLAARARNIDSSGHAALAIFHALDDAGVLAALGTGGRFRCIHDLFPVGCFCNLCHSVSPDRNVPPARRAAVLPGNWGVSSLNDQGTPATSNRSNGPAGSTRAEAVYCTRHKNLTRIAAVSSRFSVLRKSRRRASFAVVCLVFD